MVKKLSVAFIWHMHQPYYKDPQSDLYLMPWVRLHAIKDYLDMLLILDDYKNIKQTFNIVPLLLDQLEDYGHNCAHDVHSELTVKSIDDLRMEDRIFIFNSFFDANYSSMIAPNRRYKELYDKRFAIKDGDIESFSDQEYSDIMMWFNLAWFDPYWKESIPELRKLVEKEKNYSFEDRIKVIEIQRDIIRKIIPAYKERFESGKIEISTSPYYHSIMPLILDSYSAKNSSNAKMPSHRYQSEEDIVFQLEKSVKKIEDTFGQKPKGLWPPEHCVSNDIVALTEKMGFRWTISDQGILEKTLNKEFVRNFDGILKNPYDLCNSYTLGSKAKGLKILFRNSFVANLISFEYGAYSPKAAANDLYERLKIAQEKLDSSPDNHHIVTIAMDCENCWELYKDDGRQFLKNLYTLLDSDETLDVTTVSDYLDKIDKSTELKNVHSGSWVNRDFQMWIGEPTKNLAWDYLYKAKQDLISFSKEDFTTEQLEEAWNEYHIALGSDWQWWFGEPNNSGQDELFDLLFRKHLIRIYQVLGKKIPDALRASLEEFMLYSSSVAPEYIKPKIDGDIEVDGWNEAKQINAADGPVYNYDKLFNKIYYGNDEDNIYFRFDINKAVVEGVNKDKVIGQIFIYFQSLNNSTKKSYVRAKTTTKNPPEYVKYGYSHEIEIPIVKQDVTQIAFSKAIDNCLWKINLNHNIKYKYDKVIEMAIPFDELGVEQSQKVNITLLTAKSSIIDEVITPDKPITFIRP